MILATPNHNTHEELQSLHRKQIHKCAKDPRIGADATPLFHTSWRSKQTPAPVSRAHLAVKLCCRGWQCPSSATPHQTTQEGLAASNTRRQPHLLALQSSYSQSIQCQDHLVTLHQDRNQHQPGQAGSPRPVAWLPAHRRLRRPATA